MTWVYRTGTSLRLLAVVLVPPLMLIFGSLMLHPFNQMRPEPWVFVFFLVTGGGINLYLLYILVLVFRWRVEVWPDRLREVGLFRVNQLGFDQIRGIQFASGRFVRYLEFVPYGRKPRILRIKLIMGHARKFTSWAADRFEDLEQKQAEAVLREVLNDESLGANAEQRFHAFRAAWQWSRVLSAIGAAAAAAALFYPKPYLLVMGVSLVLPLVAVASMGLFPLALTFDAKRRNPRPAVFLAMLLGAIGLAFRAMSDFQVLRWQPFWVPFTFISAMLFVLLLFKAADVWRKWSLALLALVICLVYGYGATITLNGITDSSVPQVYPARVLAKGMTTGKYTEYHLRLSPWGQKNAAEDVEVPRSVYEARNVGSTVSVFLYGGRFKIPWFYVR